MELALSLCALAISLYCLVELKYKKPIRRRRGHSPEVKHPESMKPHAKRSPRITPKVNDDIAGWRKENDLPD